MHRYPSWSHAVFVHNPALASPALTGCEKRETGNEVYLFISCSCLDLERERERKRERERERERKERKEERAYVCVWMCIVGVYGA